MFIIQMPVNSRIGQYCWILDHTFRISSEHKDSRRSEFHICTIQVLFHGRVQGKVNTVCLGDSKTLSISKGFEVF